MSSEEREEVKISEKDNSCLKKIMTLLLVSVTSVNKIPDREWLRSDHRAENPGIWKKEDELRLDSWIQIRSTR